MHVLALLLHLATVRQALDAYDFTTAVCCGAPAQLDQRAWYIVSWNRIDPMRAETLADELRREHPESPWTWLALAYVYRDDLDHLADNKLIVEKLANETDDDLVIARAIAVNSTMEPEEALKLLDARPKTVPVLIAKAGIYQGLPSHEEEAVAAYSEALLQDPSNVVALTRLGGMLKQLRRRDEAAPIIERAAKLSRYAMAKQAPNAEALEAWIRESGGDPFVMAVASTGFRALGMDERACELEDRIMLEAPASAQALNVLMSHAKGTPMWRDVIDYPYQRDSDDVAIATFLLLRESNDDKEIASLAHNFPVSVNHAIQLALAMQKLADRKLDLDYAEKTTRLALQLNETHQLEAKLFPPEMRAETGRASRGTIHDSLGWVLLAEGKTKEAEKELLAARAFYPESATIAYHLGCAYEAQKMTTKAQQIYAEGLALQSVETNPNRAALESLYRAKHKSLAGFDAYLHRLDNTTDSNSKERVLASRIAKPHRAPEFRLKSLDGKTVSLDDLKGKVAVVNFWGVWCGWCVREMPDFAKLAKLYAKDDKVRILTIDTDGDPEVVRRWMKEHRYDFPVLLDNGWTQHAGVFAFPTTWFLDPYGRIAFKKEGWTEKLVDQFSWRINVLKK